MKDLLIIGGGINGVGIARDAVGRGLKVTLIEKGDLASQTSSWSTKLIHGGIRYLENYEFRLVRESLKEREVIKRIAPHITKPIRFVMPHVSNLRPLWLIRIGLLLYDWLGGFITLPKSKLVNLNKDYLDNPLEGNYTNGFEYSDLFVDDARLVLLNAQDAKLRGAEILTQTAVVGAIRHYDHWEVKLDSGLIIKAKLIINASGPFALDTLNKICNVKTKKSLRLVQGSHIIVNQLYKGDQAYILQLEDKRIIFLIPYLSKYTLIGTTDHEVQSYVNPTISEIEIEYLIKAANSFVKNKISKEDIVWTYAGIRPLLEDFNQNASKVTRDYTFELNEDGAPILTIFGGKLTTYRKLAEHALEKISKFFDISNKSWTGNEKLPGSNSYSVDQLKFDLPQMVIQRLMNTYGDKILILQNYYSNLSKGGEKITEDLYEFEVSYLVQEELVTKIDDILFRRTKLGISFPEEKKDQLAGLIKKYS
jgi:glycerol-3-phosphate dehydrogenase